ncbi:MAG TPA: adenylate/guanylate cyclase domain-containing protein [Candidatus Dormibacteraeota bacterium]|nr:adenylate/guanylate cyclase domain-containing protein [Candidatus Dormibacteraeota bacterium]
MNCPGCRAEIPNGAKFCPSCGLRVSRTCPNCGAVPAAEHRFCLECGASLDDAEPALVQATGSAAHARSATSAAHPGTVVAERRLVSVLFADLVGFTPLSERRDPEEVRELLTRYFDTCHRVITRYGGTVEKFIGDAVMAVWGTPTAREDDAERAVRAALELTDAVSELGIREGIAALRLRAGVVTGEAATTTGGERQGMVAGDIVNTASRVQSVAPAGGVLVDEPTRRITERALAYEDAGAHVLKGKSEPVQMWRATRVIAMIGGARGGSGLEAPFVGRDRELRLVKELFHSSVDEGRARLVSVTGHAGIGKSRLAWEFEKYIDGIADTVLWHRGRCLAYGDGVTYWALAEMVRRRIGVTEGEDPRIAAVKLAETVARYVTDVDEQRWLEPRLSHLLGIDELNAPEHADLFAAWRLFFERLAEQSPVVLLFEEMQWADAGLVDFIEYLLEWSRRHPLYVLTLARPEFTERHPTWGAGRRSFTSLYLDPLSTEAMDALLGGLVPGLPAAARDRIREQAEGVPLYAVETVRMLLDRGRLRREANAYVLTDAGADFEVPDTLHALVAARLDGLSNRERALLQDAAVLGHSFLKERVGSLSGVDEPELSTLLDTLVRKEMLTIQSDPRSPERGQYAFVQTLVQRVAYETLSRRDRKARHLDAARQLEATWVRDADEVVEVLAAHYIEAYEAAPNDSDATDIRDSARAMLVRAGNRAASLAASLEAERYFLRAAAFANVAAETAELLERAGEMAALGGRHDVATAHFNKAHALFIAEGLTHPAARVSARLGELEWLEGDADGAVARLEKAFEVLSSDEPDGDVGSLAAQLARFQFFRGDNARAAAAIEVALDIAETLSLPELVAQSLITKALVVNRRGHTEESMALLTHALAVALDRDVPRAAMRAHTNIASVLYGINDFAGAIAHSRSCVALARKRGDRASEIFALSNVAGNLYCVGEWDEALELGNEVLNVEEARTPTALGLAALTVQFIHINRGDVTEGRRIMELCLPLEASSDRQVHTLALSVRAQRQAFDGQLSEALATAGDLLEEMFHLGSADDAWQIFKIGIDAALALGDLDRADALVRRVDQARGRECSTWLRGLAQHARGRIAAARGQHDRVVPSFAAALQALRSIDVPFDLAVTLLEQGEWLAGQGRRDDAGPLLMEAQGIFESLKAAPWLERVGRALNGELALEQASGSRARA